MHRRVRLLYLEFMYLLPQLDSFFTPRGTAAATNANSRPPSPTLSRPFFLRVADDHPVCVPLRRGRAVEFRTRRQEKNEGAADADAASERMVVFKLQTSEEVKMLDAYMPKGWENNRRVSASNLSAQPPQLSAEAEYRAHVQQLFYANALVPVDAAEWKRCLARGRYELRGIQNVLHVRKYRALNKRYGWSSQLSRTELEAVWAGDMAQVEQALLGLSNKDVYGYAESAEREDEEVAAP
ncbi:hypothetical protein ABB37_03206 [Leptomonas pyrrhocoris]|uniref:Uncharacterized protein n=1 Tax=Leptomonas pyrrhocoris TaxID=157538 RepID=A0A0M9G4M9_LEPPY|nr:hypothetical protein ABB37_03206 [Leptomonas pyrrhocoris]XP_015660474.1 hypothetical protein ABB37_03206 [Leptomonas pyrrhocoris]XP_015660475.1 hypothetical protein ABB37_03206 [Leptomonas pyrrhocoris]KPA82034.1 hypothetical protein ABB37_03206 [Leptomonas pyrrhocoris]KPA82035.1 hypothetical protein ABB37_03206 [Leptomonas pyrrhocoris]KPA82036.1 hypothetical protein ABB37_03206 [Leptomonas pyrrhocoris]|eukprot:XP_015660473.1 hypothetical protein ABB37_03206 [Leptomonas pyrrhocoris]